MIGKIIKRRYEIISLLGKGTFGTTYLAQDNDLPGYRCVVKHFTPSSKNPEELNKATELFAREAQTLQKFPKHNQIPTLLAYVQEDQDFFIIQEYIEGHDLTEELSKLAGVTMHENSVIELLIDILEVLAIIHENKIIHRDLKPSNIRRRTKDNKIVIIDFGAVKQVGDPVQTIVGTFGYMAPEQIRKKPQLNSDIYSIGIIGIQALTGIDALNLKEDSVTRKIIWRNSSKVSHKLANILDKMVSYDPTERYETTQKALKDLKVLKSGGDKLNVWWIIVVSFLLITITGLAIFLFIKRPVAECGGSTLPYSHQKYLVNIPYPECWNRDDSEDPYGKIVTFIQPDLKAKLIIHAFEYSQNLDNYQISEVDDLKTSLDMADIIKKNDAIIANKPGKMIIVTAKDGNEKIKNMYLLTLRGSTAYRITYTASEKDYDRFLPTVESMIKSLEINK
ncbi:serine/threonine protein kinase [Anabaena sp. FACHB-1237]|uniref:protein kinase domain-containing protein n=1 Tax=Anabaena sp. FACHB-1237 TaxID=2692769 RepID=UPI001680D967|nr:protein kinase [Anabaena sp. FACHB-1237]MBD2136737.1 serine/threonine protein kinase [Anabaena sp. FACHB-1237]